LEKTHSKQKIGQWVSTSLVLGNMIGSGIFLLPASLAAYGGISIFGWIISALGAIVIAKVFSELSKKIPKAGGPYAYTRWGFGDFVGFLVAWGYWISICCTNAAITVAMLSYLTVFFPFLSTSPLVAVSLGLAIIWLLTWVNNRGVKNAAWVQLVTTILKITPLIIVAIVGVFFIQTDHFQPFNLSTESDFSAILATATLTLFAFLGIESATIPSENIENPNTTIPKATMWGTWIAIGVYILGSIAVMGIIPPETLAQSDAPFADAAAVIWGPSARYWVAAGAVISTFGALNGWILMQGQVPLAAAKDGLFPMIFGKLNKWGSPARGIILSSVIISILMGMNYAKGLVKAFEFMILLSTLTVLVPYLFSSATHLLMALNEKHQKKGSWILGSLAFIFSMLAVVGSGQEVVFWGFLLLMAGIPFYVFIKKESSN
jgi:APA family basic amino acid/polyamine antiporter